VPPGGDADEYDLSNFCCSHHITHCVEKIGLQWWGSNHVRQFIIEESDEEDEEDVAEENQVTQEDGVMEGDNFINGDEEFQEDDYDYETPCAELGQEGVSVWDLLGESFLREASQLGVSTSIHTFTDV
jgi:hypothetical protein